MIDYIYLLLIKLLLFFNKSFYNLKIMQKSVVLGSAAHEQNQSGKLCKNYEEMKRPSLQMMNPLMAH